MWRFVGANLVFALCSGVRNEGDHEVRPYDNLQRTHAFAPIQTAKGRGEKNRSARGVNSPATRRAAYGPQETDT